jgi:hypothetical protein
MAQDLTVNIKTTSDVPQAMDKAKQATTGFSKQVDDIGKKFSTSFKDIFLSFLGPMALVTGAIALIGKMIADNEKKRAEANQSAIDGTNELMSAEDRYYAKKRDNENKSREKVEQAQLTREEITSNFLRDDPRGQAIARRQNELAGDLSTLGSVKTPKQIQDEVQAILAEDMKKNPLPEEVAKEAEKKAGTFKGPEGFGKVVGVGANPVMEAMSAQLEEAQKQTALLERIANPAGGMPLDFTKAPGFVAYGEQM